MTFDDFIRMLNNQEPFHFARYGDGEWNVILGKKGMNCDGHSYNLPGLQKDLRKTIDKKKTYFYGMQPLAARIMKKQIAEYLEGTFIPWIGADIFHDASTDGNLFKFVQAIRKYKICYIAPWYIGALPCMRFFEDHIIKIPETNCYKAKEEITNKLMSFGYADIYLFSAGFLTKILIWELHDVFKNMWMIDMGSVWDPYCGFMTRKYHEKLPQETIEGNMTI